MNGTERMALAGIALVVVGILTTSFHKVEIAWVTVAIMVALLLIGSIQRDDINKRIAANRTEQNAYLTMLLVQMTSDVVRAVKGMQITTVQWESHGGMMLNFKVMCIMVPQIRADHNGNTGLVHGS